MKKVVPWESDKGMTHNSYLIHPAVIVDRKQESTDFVTFRLQLTDPSHRESFRFEAGQYNMLYVFGIGEVAISIVSDPDESVFLNHTIRVVGRITKVLGNMQIGESMGVRGPFRVGWPMKEAQGKDVLIVTGGLGCGPVVGAIEYMFRRREEYGTITILQGLALSGTLRNPVASTPHQGFPNLWADSQVAVL